MIGFKQTALGSGVVVREPSAADMEVLVGVDTPGVAHMVALAQACARTAAGELLWATVEAARLAPWSQVNAAAMAAMELAGVTASDDDAKKN